jgi:hypothetical protein
LMRGWHGSRREPQYARKHVDRRWSDTEVRTHHAL